MSTTALSADPFRLLGDDVRLRVLRLLGRERLNVSELTRVLGVAQSGVSRHVRLLREGGFVREERDAGWTWLVLAADAPEGLAGLWPALRQGLTERPDLHGDDARLAVVLRERVERRVGWGRPRAPEPGRSWSAWARALGHLLPPLCVADLGCGEGALAREIARFAAEVVGVEPDAATLARARAAARKAGLRNVRWRRAPRDALPFEDACFDVALLSQVLHALEEPARAVGEAARIVKPGGRVLVLDLLPHREAWVRERLAHVHLGFEPATVGAWLRQAGLEAVRTEEAARRRGNPFTVLVASARRPGDTEGRR
jgi:ArsR family transcriptional regulator